jgi:hypothetical protein
MKKYKAKPIEEHLMNLSGNPGKKVEKLISIHYIYSKPLTESNFKKHIRSDKEFDFEVYDELDENGNRVPFGVLFYWETPILTQPKTLGQFISVASALGRELYWEEDTWVKYIYINSKY